jgi:hypothetical protein
MNGASYQPQMKDGIWWNEDRQGKPTPEPFHSSQILHELTWD